jgi:HPt (histidine-containing phosphotransfer) domain-containing protein
VNVIRNDLDNDYCKNIPIIALTANALVGNMEMFLAKGFNGFIPKPIDISQLDEALNIWVRDRHSRKRFNDPGKVKSSVNEANAPPSALNSGFAETEPLPKIPGLDMELGLEMTGGVMSLYLDVLSTYCSDIEDRLPFIRTTPNPDSVSIFTNHIHAMKSASASIGAADISKRAAELEKAGAEKDFSDIATRLPEFIFRLEKLIKNIKAILLTE